MKQRVIFFLFNSNVLCSQNLSPIYSTKAAIGLMGLRRPT